MMPRAAAQLCSAGQVRPLRQVLHRHRNFYSAARGLRRQQLLSREHQVSCTAIPATAHRRFGVASLVFGTDSPPDDARAEWETGLVLTKAGKPSDAEVAFHRALSCIDTSGYAPNSGQGRSTVAAMWRDLARVQSMQSKTHEALHNLRRALAVYDGLDHSADLLDVAQHWHKQSGVAGRLAKEMPRMPDGVPVDLLLNILDNLVSHCVQLHGDTEPFLKVRLAVLERAEAVREFHKMDTSSTLEEKAVALYKSHNADEAIVELRRAIAEAPVLPDKPQIAVVLRRITAHRTLAAWLAERAKAGGMLAQSDQDEGIRLYESALELLDSVFPESEEEPIEEDPDFKPKEQSLADALKMEVTRVRFALLLQLVRIHGAGGKEAKTRLEEVGHRLFDRDFIAKAEKMGVAAPTEEFTDPRKAWRASLLRVGAEAFTKVGSSEAAQRWRDVLDLCRSRERDVHMQMGIAKPTAEMRGETVGALVGVAAALHPPWNHLPTGVFTADGRYDEQKLESTIEEIENSLREALEIIAQVDAEDMVASKALSSIMLARTLRTPVISDQASTAGRGVSFLTNYPARAREFAKLLHDGLVSATSTLGEIPTVPADALVRAHLSDSSTGAEDEEDFGDQRNWNQLSTEEQSAAERLGWNCRTWDDGDWLDEDSNDNCVSWSALSVGSRADAETLGFDQQEWDQCYYADEHETCSDGKLEDLPGALPSQESLVVSAQWDALHDVDAISAALTLLPVESRRGIELAVDCALEQLLVVAAEIAEETVEQDALLQLSGDDSGRLQHTEARVRWWGLLSPACTALVAATAQRHGGRSEAMSSALSLLAKSKEETGQTDVALQLYKRVSREHWDGGSAVCKRIQLSAKFEIGRLYAGTMDANGLQKAEQTFRQEFELILAGQHGTDGANADIVDPELLTVFGNGLQAVLRSQGRTAEADAIVAQVAQAESNR